MASPASAVGRPAVQVEGPFPTPGEAANAPAKADKKKSTPWKTTVPPGKVMATKEATKEQIQEAAQRVITTPAGSAAVAAQFAATKLPPLLPTPAKATKADEEGDDAMEDEDSQSSVVSAVKATPAAAAVNASLAAKASLVTQAKPQVVQLQQQQAVVAAAAVAVAAVAQKLPVFEIQGNDAKLLETEKNLRKLVKGFSTLKDDGETAKSSATTVELVDKDVYYNLFNKRYDVLKDRFARLSEDHQTILDDYISGVDRIEKAIEKLLESSAVFKKSDNNSADKHTYEVETRKIKQAWDIRLIELRSSWDKLIERSSKASIAINDFKTDLEVSGLWKLVWKANDVSSSFTPSLEKNKRQELAKAAADAAAAAAAAAAPPGKK